MTYESQKPAALRSMRWLGVKVKNCTFEIADMWLDGWEGKIMVGIFAALAALILWMGVLGWQWFDALALKQGVIVGKGHSDAWVQVTFITISDGQTTTMIPQTIYWPESWSVTIEGDDYKGVHKKRTVSVSREAHDKLELGTTWRVQ